MMRVILAMIWGEPDRRPHVRADGCAPVHDRHGQPESPGAAQEVPRQFAASGGEPASGTYCLFMTDSTARQLGYRLLVGSGLELRAAANNQERTSAQCS
jgi:hypothetical protein